MSSFYDAIIIGAGHNGLVAAAQLSREGKKVIVLEKRDIVGGCLATEEFHPGFRASLATPFGQPLRPRIMSELNLKYHGLQMMHHDPIVFCPMGSDRHLALARDLEAAVAAIAEHSPQDAGRYRQYVGFMNRVREATEAILDLAPVNPDSSEPLGLVELANLGLKLRLLGPDDMHRLMRTVTMCLKDFLDEWFELDILKAALAGPALAGHHYGPYAPGTAATLIYSYLAGPTGMTKGGMGAITDTLATVLRDDSQTIETGVEVESVLIESGTAVGVRLADGRELRARHILSNLDPKRTLQKLVDPLEFEPSFHRKVRNIQMRGTTTIVTLALSELPLFECLTGVDQRKYLAGRIHFGPDLDFLEKAADAVKYGRISDAPWVTATIPTLLDPSLAPKDQHILQLEVRWTPYHLRKGSWKRQKKFLDAALAVVAEQVPNLEEIILERKVLTPLDLEETYGLTEGHIFHGERNLHQLFIGRPMAGFARYQTPIRNLMLCGSGTHPGGNTTGACGANAAREVLMQLPGNREKAQRVKRAVTSPVGAGLAAAAGLSLLGAGLAVGKALKKGRKNDQRKNEEKEDA